jgi:two-component system cell cycle response regulator CpdR
MRQRFSTSGSPPHRRRVLLVEDNEASRRGLARLLEVQGYDVTTVHDGTSALNALASGPPPDFLLTDLMLPDLDGREVARRACQLVPAPRVALITGWDVDPALGDPTAWGIDWVLTKPVDLDELMRKLDDAAPRGPADSSKNG